MLLAMALGIGAGVLLGPAVGLFEPAAATLITNWLALPGQLFLALVQMIVIPLVFASIVLGMAASDNLGTLCEIGLKVVAFLLSTTFIAVLLGMAVMLLMVYLIIYRVLTGRPVLAFLAAVRDVQLLAFSTSSSAAVMPVTIKTAEEKLGVDSVIAQFVVPLGTTVNMAGTVLYQVAATLFLAQVFTVDVGLGSLLLVAVLAIGASIGSPGTPGIGIVILAMLLGTIGIPAADIVLIIGVDRILDMSRTLVNITGDLIASTIVTPKLAPVTGVERKAAPERA
ncbi:MAG: cation:dicarboxylase symporter family transporter [Wenzhouxiangellaceae bacterium]|nr:cation:dicarboxylase symporter family transporter [Wenzhouxiangellaceae bacterium]